MSLAIVRREVARVPGARRLFRGARALLSKRTDALTFVDGLAPPGGGGAAGIRVAYVSGAPATASHLYRVEHAIGALRELGVTAFWVPDQDLGQWVTALAHCDYVVLFRVAWSDAVARAVEAVRRGGGLVVFDIDDLVFDPEVANARNVDGLRFLGDEEVARYHEGVLRYRRTLEEADFALASTPFLEARMTGVAEHAGTLLNGLSRSMLVESAAAEQSRQPSVRPRVGYASGTRTHQRDFAVAAPAVARVLEQVPDAVLTIVGELDLSEFPALARFGDRVERRALVPHERLPFELARFAVNLAPLEVGNPYCEAKSELKWFEAAVVGVPTVASPTETFRGAITDGVDGMLADGDDEWERALLALLTDVPHRTQMAQAARTAAIARHGPKARVEDVRALLSAFETRRRALGPARRKLQRITFALPAMLAGSGGHGVVLGLARALAREGRSVHVLFDGPSPEYPTPTSVAERHGLAEAGVAVSYSQLLFAPADVLVATYWTTVEPCIRFAAVHPVPVVQLVQDYEPWFFPMGEEYLGAQRALRRGQRLICWGQWLADFIYRHHGIESDALPYSLDHSTYMTSADVRRSSDHVVFFARPDMPRRLFGLGLAALRELERRRPGTRVTVFGSDATRALGLPATWRDVGVVTPAQLVALYQEATLGLAFSPTNPSSVPFEMMACGLPVVDVALEDSEGRYGSRENAILAEPTAEEVASSLDAALADHELRARTAAAALEFTRGMPSREFVAERFAGLLNGAYERFHA